MTATATIDEVATAEQAFGELTRHAEQIKNDEHQTAGEMDVGDAWAQGDLALVRISGVPEDAKCEVEPSLQLAPGTTQGSRHLLDTLSGDHRVSPQRPDSAGRADSGRTVRAAGESPRARRCVASSRHLRRGVSAGLRRDPPSRSRLIGPP